MNIMLSLMIAFAATGEIGAFKLGMPSEEADRLLGGGTDLVLPTNGSRDGVTGFKDGSLEVWVGPGATVQLLGFDAIGVEDGFQSPSCIGLTAQVTIPAPTQDMLINGLAQRGCAWSRDYALTSNDQLALRTEADVSAVFAHSNRSANEWVLASLYRSARES